MTTFSFYFLFFISFCPFTYETFTLAIPTHKTHVSYTFNNWYSLKLIRNCYYHFFNPFSFFISSSSSCIRSRTAPEACCSNPDIPNDNLKAQICTLQKSFHSPSFCVVVRRDVRYIVLIVLKCFSFFLFGLLLLPWSDCYKCLQI